MGYFIQNKDKIAKVTEPARVSLSDHPNFIQFESNTQPSHNKTVVTIMVVDDISEDKDFSITFTEKETNLKHEFKGTIEENKVDDKTFFVDLKNPAATANNLRECLLKIPFFFANFNISPPFSVLAYNGELVESRFISFEPKGRGDQYTFTVTSPSLPEGIFSVNGNFDNNKDEDTISVGAKNCEIHLDVYKDIYKNSKVFLGMDDKPEPAHQSGGMFYDRDRNKLGVQVATFSKTYHGQPLWFNLNSIKASGYSTDFLNEETDWCDAGTMSDIRIMASRYLDGKRDVFYLSNVLYRVTGYARNLDSVDMAAYIYNADEKGDRLIKPLTEQPQLFHIKGQSQYFNFILSDPNHETMHTKEKLAITYKLFTTSDREIGEVTDHKKELNKFSMVNTIRLDIDGAIGEKENVGFVEVYLSRLVLNEDTDTEYEYEIVSRPLRFQILPGCLYKVNDFAFLNRLGGWSSFNFAGMEKTDFKTTTATISKTHLPDKTVSDEIESVYRKSVSEQFSVQTMPITNDVCDWLKELSTSKAVYELSTKRYVVVDELNIKPDSKDDLSRLEMKYHYSDSYNAVID